MSDLRAKAGAFKGVTLAGPKPSDPELRRRVETFRQVPKLTQAAVDDVVTTLTPLLDVIVAAAGSDKAALSQLPASSITASILALQVENRYLAAQSELSSSDGPGRHLMRANIACNEGVIALLEHQRELASGRSPSAAATATRLRGRAAETRLAATAVSDSAKAMLNGEVLQGLRREAPASHAKLAGAVGTFEESARVEARIAEVLKGLADALEQGAGGRSEFDSRAAELDVLIDRRMKAAQDRIALAGS